MCVGSPTAGAWSSFQRRPDDEFETDSSRCRPTREILHQAVHGQEPLHVGGRLVVALLSLMSMLSLNLGILNLLPVPILDGGHIMNHGARRGLTP